MKWNELSKAQQLMIGIAAVVVVAAVVAGGMALAGKGGSAKGDGSGETTSTAGSTESSASAEASGSVGDRSTNAPAEQDYEKYVYVMDVKDNTLHVDYFELLKDDAAQKYAQEHGEQVPMNGILPVPGELEYVAVPMAEKVEIKYATGTVAEPKLTATTPDALGKWVAGDVAAMPGARTNMWKLTVKGGVATKLEMIIIAD